MHIPLPWWIAGVADAIVCIPSAAPRPEPRGCTDPGSDGGPIPCHAHPQSPGFPACKVCMEAEREANWRPQPAPLPAALRPLAGLSCLYSAWRFLLSPTSGIDSSCADRHLFRFNVRNADSLTHGRRQRLPRCAGTDRGWELRDDEGSHCAGGSEAKTRQSGQAKQP